MKQFLSTPSARRATRGGRTKQFLNRISIHALREEGDARRDLGIYRGCKISIHALREEGDTDKDGDLMTVTEFLSTPSARRAT